MIAVTSRENLADLNGNRNSKDVVGFSLDDTADINNLPGVDQIQIGSTAFVISTGDCYILGSNGWRQI